MTGERYFAAPLSWLAHDGKLLAISRLRPRWAVLNETAAALVHSCDAEEGRSIEDIEAAFRRRFGPVARPELAEWLGRLEESELLFRRPGGTLPAAPSGFDGYRVEHVYLELLARCNLRCVHCFMGGAPEREERLEPEEVTALLEEFAAAGGRYVTLSGGEPLIYPEFAAVARKVAALSLHGTVITNGVSLRPSALALMDSLGFNLAISLDGITPAVNKRIRGRGSAPVIAAIEQALERLGPERVILSFTPVKANLEELPALFDFIEQKGIRRLNLSIYEEVGRAAEFAPELTLDAADRRRLMHIVYHKAVALAGRVEIDLNDTRDILSQFSAERSTVELHPLWRGVRITSSGEVFPSSFGAVERFRLGNIRQTPLGTLLRSAVLSELYAALLDRDAKTEKCRDCAWRQICRGGSVASAYCATGELYAPDAYCDAYLAVFPAVAVALAELETGRRA
ncbi:MAG TPA: radical SAM protein [Stellaceae bacterium]|nr:radical SAM protein [Stellaceae bacterium]